MTDDRTSAVNGPLPRRHNNVNPHSEPTQPFRHIVRLLSRDDERPRSDPFYKVLSGSLSAVSRQTLCVQRYLRLDAETDMNRPLDRNLFSMSRAPAGF